MSRPLHQHQQGFSAIELLITLFVAAAFLIAGYQLYFVIIKDNGQTRSQARAANLAYNYLRQYSATVSAPCSPGTVLAPTSVTVAGLSGVQVGVVDYCPYSTSTGTNSATNITRVEVTVTYNAGQQVIYDTFTHETPSTSPADITNGLVGWWKFDGNSQASVGVDGALIGPPPLVKGQTGQPNSAYSFDGTSQFIQVPSNLGLGTTSVTMALWVNNPTATNQGEFLKVGGTGYGVGIGTTSFGTTSPGTKLIGLYESVRWIVTTKDVGTGWHFIVMAIDGSSVPSLYEDGLLIGTYPGTAAQPPGGARINIGGDGATRDFAGSIDDVRIYNRVLSSAEITSLYNAGAQ